MNSKRYLLFVVVLLAGWTYPVAYGQKPTIYQEDWTEDEGSHLMKIWASEWNTRADWEKRAAVIREGILHGLQWDRMPKVDNHFNPIIRSTRTMDGYIVENIAFESFPGFYITGNIYRPINPEGRCAAVLCPHGHWVNRRMSPEVQIRCAALARMGAVVMTWDMLGYGECHQATHDNPLAMVIQTWNSKRVIDYLVSRPDVDPTRIGITGASGGATQTFLITAIDHRITVAAPVAQVSAHFFGGCVCEAGMPIHHSDHHQTNNVEIAALCAPRPLLIVSDGSDWTRNTPRVEFPYLEKVYAAYDAENRLENVHLAGERHDYGPSKRFPVYTFLAHYLNLRLGRIPYHYGFDEGFVTILPVDELRVFTPDFPLPSNALQGDEAIVKYLNIKN